MSGDALILTLDPVHPGGIQTMQRAAVRALRAIGVEPHLAYLRSDRRGRVDLRLRRGVHEGVPTISAGYWPTLEYLNYVFAAAMLRRELRRFAAIHVVSSFHSPSLVPILCRRGFVSWVATPFRDEIESRYRAAAPSVSVRLNYAGRAANEAIEGHTYRRSLATWALSSYTARRLREIHGLPPGAVDVQGAPIDFEVFRPEGPRWSEEPYVLTVGRLDEERKNYPLLLRSFATATGRRPDVKLVLVGPGREGSGLADIARELGIAARVVFAGVLPEPELAAAYRGALCFVLSSHQEGLGLVVLEAQASGLASVATRCGGVEDLVLSGETGLLAEADDASGLAACLERVLDDRVLARRLGAAARARVERHWGHESFAARLRALYVDCFPSLGSARA